MSEIKVGDYVRKHANAACGGAEGVVTEISRLGSISYRCTKASACGFMKVGYPGSDYPEHFELIESAPVPLAEQIAEAEAKLAELKKAEVRLAAVVPGAKFQSVNYPESVFAIIAIDDDKCWYRSRKSNGDSVCDRSTFSDERNYTLVTD